MFLNMVTDENREILYQGLCGAHKHLTPNRFSTETPNGINPNKDRNEGNHYINQSKYGNEANSDINPNKDRNEANHYINPNKGGNEANHHINPNKDKNEANHHINPNKDRNETNHYINPNKDRNEANHHINPNKDKNEANHHINPNKDRNETNHQINPNKDNIDTKNNINSNLDITEGQNDIIPRSDSHNRINNIVQEEFNKNFTLTIPPEGDNCEASQRMATDHCPLTGSTEILLNMHEDQSNTNTPQNKDLMDEDVNEFVENLQIPSPQGSEISYGNIMSVNTLVGFLDESIEIFQSREPSPEDPVSVNKMKNLPPDDSDLNVSSTEHCDSGNNENTYDCHLCNKSFRSTSWRILIAHLSWVHNQCPHCDQIFQCQSDLTTHLRTHPERRRRHYCALCGKYCYTNRRLTEHLNLFHKRGEFYQCNKCEKSFKFKVTLNEHLKTHYEKQLYKCYHCDKTYKRITYFIQHILTMHSKSPEKPMLVKEMNKLPCDDQDVYLSRKLPQNQVKNQCIASASVANDNAVMCTNESSKDSDYYYKVISQQIATEGLTVVKQDETNHDNCHRSETIVDEATMTTNASKNPGHCDLSYHGEIATTSHSNCGVDSEQNVTQTQQNHPYLCALIGTQSTEMFKQIAETDGNPILAQEIIHNDQRYRTAEGSQFNSSTEHCKPGFSANNQKCPLCNKSFPSQRILSVHFRRVHQCGHCGQIFECESDLTIHRRAHHCTPYHCNQCDKKYFRIQSFNQASQSTSWRKIL